MRAIIQRVKKADVKVSGKVVGKINAGYLVLLGITDSDDETTATDLAAKISKLRLMSDSNEKMNLDLQQAGASVLVVSQFTLYADTSKGNRPSFVKAATPDHALPLYDLFVETLHSFDIPVQTGQFGSYMDIKVELDGPVTITLEQ